MARKTPQNRYGIKLNDIFAQDCSSPEGNSYNFYQVVALRGELTVAVRRISEKIAAFDGRYESVVPVLDNWVNDEELVRRVQKNEHLDKLYIEPDKHYFRAYKEDGLFLEFPRTPHGYPEELCKSDPELAEQLDLEKGSGIFLIENMEQKAWRDYDQKALIRYPDGREEETTLKDLFNKNK